MRTDPRAACANAVERFGWALLHDAFCHPLMALSGWSGWSLRLHDWTSHRAWPRVVPELASAVVVPSARWGALPVRRTADGLYTVTHPTVAHSYTTPADDAVHAVEIASLWFDGLARDFGGAFAANEAKEAQTP